MAETRTHAGFVYTRQPDGSWKKTGAANNGPRPITIGAPDPRIQPDVANTQATTAKTIVDTDKTRTDIRDTSEDNARADAQLVAELFSKGLRLTGRTDPATGKPEIEPIPGWKDPSADPKTESDKAVAARRILEMLDGENGIVQQFTDNFEGGGIGALNEYNPFRGENQQFDVKANAMLPFAKKLLRTPGEGSQSDKEAQDYRDQLPRASFRDETNRQLISDLRQTALSVLENEGVDVSTYDQTAGTFRAPAAPPKAAGAGATETTVPLPEGFQGGYDAILSRLKDGSLTPEQYAAFRVQQDRENFGEVAKDQQYKYLEEGYQLQQAFEEGLGVEQVPPIGPATREMSQTEQFRNNLANNPLGAAAINYMDMAGMGGVTALAGDQMQALNEAQPMGALAGQIGGAVTGTAAIGKAGRMAAGKIAPNLLGGGRKAQFGRNLATDILYGAGYGGIAQGDPLSGAAMAGVGSAGGQLVGKAAGKAIGGINVDPAVDYLRSRNIPLTTGQTVGGMAKGIEDRMAGLPLVGDMVNARRTEGLNAFNREAFDTAGAPIGFSAQRIGREGVADLQGAQGQAYDNAVAGRVFPIDNGFNQSIDEALGAAKALPDDLSARAQLAFRNRIDPLRQGAAVSRLEAPSSLATPLNPTPDQMQRLSRVEEVPLAQVRSDQFEMDWAKNGRGNYQEPLIPGFGDMPVAVRMNNGELRIIDGNHRTVNALNAGQKTAKMRVINASDFDPANAGPRASSRSDTLDLTDDELLSELGVAPDSIGKASQGGYTPTGREAITGSQYQQARRGLAGYKAETTKPGFEEDYRNVIGRGQTALDDLVKRQGGEDVVQGLDNANFSYRMGKVVEDATGRAKGGSQSGELYTFTPSQLQMANQASARKFPGENPLVELADQGQRVLPSKVPDSGTAGRLAMLALPGAIGGGATVGGLAGAGGGLPGAQEGAQSGAITSGTLAAALMLLGTRQGQKIMNTMLVQRPDAVRRVGQGISRRSGLFGSAAVPLAITN